MKRGYQGNEKPKRARFSEPEDWVSATRVKNFLIKDPLLDVLSLKESVGNRRSSSENLPTFENYIMKRGLEFEDAFIKVLQRKYPSDFVNIGAQQDPTDSEYVSKTLQEMTNGTPFIYSGLVKDEETFTFGIPDLIVRSDWLSKLASVPPITRSESRVPAPDVDAPDYHYRIVDIKFTTLNLRADGVHILNSGFFPAYKGQLWIYTRALGKMQGYTPPEAYLLGKRWKYTTRGVVHKGSGCDQLLGTVDFRGVDQEWVDKTDQAADWIRDARKNYQSWSLDKFPLPRKELYPNMSNTHDGHYHGAKVELANRIGEITKMWMCGVSNREYAHEQGVMSLFDPKISSKILGLRGKKVAPIVDAIIKVNSPTYPHPTYPVLEEISREVGKEYRKRGEEFFVDFEFFNDVFGEIKIPISGSSEMIFMIGVGREYEGEWMYKSFTATNISLEEERRICSEFREFVFSFSDVPKLYHWSHAESTQWSRACKRLLTGGSYPSTTLSESNYPRKTSFEWIDLLNVFRKTPITIKGCYDFGLKSVTKALAEHLIIPNVWEGLTITNGLDAMYQAYQALSKKDVREIKEIERYNQQDCRALFELLKMIRG